MCNFRDVRREPKELRLRNQQIGAMLTSFSLKSGDRNRANAKDLTLRLRAVVGRRTQEWEREREREAGRERQRETRARGALPAVRTLIRTQHTFYTRCAFRSSCQKSISPEH